MAEKTPADQASALLHELAEALQATGAYLGALRHGMAGPGLRPPDAEIVERSLSQWARAQHALRELRTTLKGDPDADG